MFEKHSYGVCFTVAFFVMFGFSLLLPVSCDCYQQHTAGQPPCVECTSYNLSFLCAHKSSPNLCPNASFELLILVQCAYPSDGYPAGIFHPPITLI